MVSVLKLTAMAGEGLNAAGRRVYSRGRKTYRTWRLESGEAGWGRPAGPDLVVAGDEPATVVIVGAGLQGRLLATSVGRIAGAEIAGLADLDRSRLDAVGAELGIEARRLHTDVDQLFATPVDLAVIATTAPSHGHLALRALEGGARRILVEKPMDTSWAVAADLLAGCQQADVPLGVGYSRRWWPDHQAIKRAIEGGAIGSVRRFHAMVGAGELAMHGSHFFDLARMLIGAEAEAITADLRPSVGPNVRGAEFTDPTGSVTVTFAGGARAIIDVERDLPRRTLTVLIVGDGGTILVEEAAGHWTLRGGSGRSWLHPFGVRLDPVAQSAHTLHGMLVDDTVACSGEDGLAALEFILAAHHANDRDEPVSLPLGPTERSLAVQFP